MVHLFQNSYHSQDQTYLRYDKLSGKDGPRTVILSSKYRDRFKMQIRELHFYSPMPLNLSPINMSEMMAIIAGKKNKELDQSEETGIR